MNVSWKSWWPPASTSRSSLRARRSETTQRMSEDYFNRNVMERVKCLEDLTQNLGKVSVLPCVHTIARKLSGVNEFWMFAATGVENTWPRILERVWSTIKSKRAEVDIFNLGINIRATRGGKLGRVNPPLVTIDGDVYVPPGVVRWL